MGEFRDVIFRCNTDVDVVNAKKIGLKNGYEVPSYSRGYNSIVSCRYIIFSYVKEDGSKMILTWEDNPSYTPEYIIDEQLQYNKGGYKYTDNIDELNFLLVQNNAKFINYNKPTKLVYEDGIQVLKYDQFDNLEYRKGSIEFGGILTKLLEFLRLYKDDLVGELKFTITDFEKQSNIKIDLVKKLIGSKENGQKLYDFSISIENDSIYFNDLNKNGKSRPFESNIY